MPVTSIEQATEILTPVLARYDDCFENNKIDELITIYGKDAVLVTKGHGAVHGRDAIGKELAKFNELGKTETKVDNKRIEGFGDHIVYRANYCTTVVESGKITKGSYKQIFREEDGQWLICFDEFSME